MINLKGDDLKKYFTRSIVDYIIDFHYNEYILFYSKLDLGFLELDSLVTVVDLYDFNLRSARYCGLKERPVFQNVINLLLYIIKNKYSQVVVFNNTNTVILGDSMECLQKAVIELFDYKLKFYLYPFNYINVSTKTMSNSYRMPLEFAVGISKLNKAKTLLVLPHALSLYVKDFKATYKELYSISSKKTVIKTIGEGGFKFNDEPIELISNMPLYSYIYLNKQL